MVLIMWVCIRIPGQSIELEIQGFTNVVKVSRVTHGQYVWITINGEMFGPLVEGAEVTMACSTAILLKVVRFKGQEVTFGIKASREVKLRAV